LIHHQGYGKKGTKMNMSMSKVAVAASHICLGLSLFFVPASWGAEQEITKAAHCAFSVYLEDPDNRARYEKALSKGRYKYATVNNRQNAAVYGVIAKAGYSAENGKNLDSFSIGCLTCHDGTTASKVRPTIINMPGNRSVIKMISAKHPIGMDYEKYSATNRSLKSLDARDNSLTLAEGRVGCITCHDPLNSSPNHLRVTESGIDLCTACHNV
jgi:predicted CXXCH cytochrome family protein